MSAPSGYNLSRIPRFSPEQMQLFQSLFGGIGPQAGQGADLLGKFALGDQGSYDALQKPALNQFNQQLIPQLADRFASHGTLNSSAFRNAAAGAAGNLADSLGSQRNQIQMDALNRLLGLSESLLGQQPFENFLTKKSNFWDNLGGGLTGAASGAGSLFSGIGALKGLFGGGK